MNFLTSEVPIYFGTFFYTDRQTVFRLVQKVTAYILLHHIFNYQFMSIDEIKKLPVYAECYRNSVSSNPGESTEFHVHNACSEVAERMSLDLSALSNELADLAADFSTDFQDCDLESTHDDEPDQYGGSEHCGLEPIEYGREGYYEDFEDGEVSHDFERKTDEYHDEPYKSDYSAN